MKKHVQHFFVPHHGNNFHPALLHRKRVIFYGGFFVAVKAIVVCVAVLLPLQAFTSEDILRQEQQKLIGMTNITRSTVGVAQVSTDPKLTSSANLKSVDMATREYFSHSSPSGQRLKNYLTQVDYSYKTAGENLAMGFFTAEEIIDAWKKSPTHYSNIVDGDFEEMGISLVAGEWKGVPTVYVTQHFGTPKPIPTSPTESEETSQPQVQPTEEPLEIEPEIQAPDSDLVLPESESMPTVVYETTKPKIEETIEQEVELAQPDEQLQLVSGIVQFEETTEKTLRLATEIEMNQPVEQEAFVQIGPHRIILETDESQTILRGTLGLEESKESFFRIVYTPYLHIGSEDDKYVSAIEWEQVELTPPGAYTRYTKAKTSIGGLTNLFSLSQQLYIAALTLFTAVLVATIIIEIKTQHLHVIRDTGMLIGLLVLFIFV